MKWLRIRGEIGGFLKDELLFFQKSFYIIREIFNNDRLQSQILV